MLDVGVVESVDVIKQNVSVSRFVLRVAEWGKLCYVCLKNGKVLELLDRIGKGPCLCSSAIRLSRKVTLSLLPFYPPTFSSTNSR